MPNRDCFVQVFGMEGSVQQVIVDDSRTFIVTDQELYALGKNDEGQLGLGDKLPRKYIIKVSHVNYPILEFIASQQHTLIRTQKGLYACGNNHSDQLGLGHTTSPYTFQHLQALPKGIKENGRYQRLFGYLLKVSQMPGFFQIALRTRKMGQDEQEADKQLTASL